MRADFIHIETRDGKSKSLGFVNDKNAFGAALVAAQADPAMVRIVVANRSPVRVFHNKAASPAPAATTSRKKTSSRRKA